MIWSELRKTAQREVNQQIDNLIKKVKGRKFTISNITLKLVIKIVFKESIKTFYRCINI